MPLTVVLACTHRIFSAGIAALLRSQPRIDVVGEATDCATAARLAVETRAHVIVADLAVLGSNGLALFTGTASSPVRIILLAARSDEARVLDELRRGAWGVVLKDAAPDLLIRSILAAAAGEAWVDRDTVSRLLESIHDRSGARRGAPNARPLLTPREIEIVAELTLGSSNGDIGRKLGLQAQTVKNRLSSIFDKLGVSSRLELALYALNHDLPSLQQVRERPVRQAPRPLGSRKK